MAINCETHDSWESYGEYFKKRTMNDITAEHAETHDEWRECHSDYCGKEEDDSWE